MNQIAQTLTGVLPILLLLALGVVLRLARVLDDHTVDGLKKLVVTVVLPVVLFRAFLAIEFQAEYLAIIVLVPVICLALLGFGHALSRVIGGQASGVVPYLTTGFEFGMVGLALFTAAYGTEHLPVVGMVGLGHEFFIWFIFVTLLNRAFAGRVSMGETVKSFVTSPVIIGIALGVVLNVAGLAAPLAANPVGAALMTTLDYLAAIIVPVILMIVGYGTRLTRRGVLEALPLVAARFAVAIPLALVLNAVVIRGLLGLPPMVEAALFTLLILPPPFIVPLFLPPERRREIGYATNVLSLSTVVSVAAFIVYIAVT